MPGAASSWRVRAPRRGRFTCLSSGSRRYSRWRRRKERAELSCRLRELLRYTEHPSSIASYCRDWRRILDAKILVVDDDPQVRDTLQAVLSSFGCQVSSRSDGEEALTAIKE